MRLSVFVSQQYIYAAIRLYNRRSTSGSLLQPCLDHVWNYMVLAWWLYLEWKVLPETKLFASPVRVHSDSARPLKSWDEANLWKCMDQVLELSSGSTCVFCTLLVCFVWWTEHEFVFPLTPCYIIMGCSKCIKLLTSDLYGWWKVYPLVAYLAALAHLRYSIQQFSSETTWHVAALHRISNASCSWRFRRNLHLKLWSGRWCTTTADKRCWCICKLRSGFGIVDLYTLASYWIKQNVLWHFCGCIHTLSILKIVRGFDQHAKKWSY